jgi:hypothetical protein
MLTVAFVVNVTFQLFEMVMDRDVSNKTSRQFPIGLGFIEKSIGRIKALSTDVNFQNDLQYSINSRLISRISSNPNHFSRIFSSFQAEAVISQ